MVEVTGVVEILKPKGRFTQRKLEHVVSQTDAAVRFIGAEGQEALPYENGWVPKDKLSFVTNQFGEKVFIIPLPNLSPKRKSRKPKKVADWLCIVSIIDVREPIKIERNDIEDAIDWCENLETTGVIGFSDSHEFRWYPASRIKHVDIVIRKSV
jgi:hypothetical protein